MSEPEARLARFVEALAGEEATIPVGAPLARRIGVEGLADRLLARLAPAFAQAIARFWRDAGLGGEPPRPLEIGATPAALAVCLHDLLSVACREHPDGLRAVGEFARSLPVARTPGEILAAHALLRHAPRWHGAWPDPVRAVYDALVERSPLTRIVQAELSLARDWTGTDVLFSIARLRPCLRNALVPAGGSADALRAAGAVLDVLREGRGFPAQRAFVLDVYDAFLYHTRESIPVAGARGERFHWPIFADLERLLRSPDRAENAAGARRFAYFDPLLEIAAAEPAALETFPNLTREALETLAALARLVARGRTGGLAFARG